jgi:hypothetical protein
MSVNRNVRFVFPFDDLNWPANPVRHEKFWAETDHMDSCVSYCILEFVYFGLTQSHFVIHLPIYFLLKTLVHNIQSRINRLHIASY